MKLQIRGCGGERDIKCLEYTGGIQANATLRGRMTVLVLLEDWSTALDRIPILLGPLCIL